LAQIHIQYFAQLKDQANKLEEVLDLKTKTTAGELYETLSAQYGFSLKQNEIRVAINDRFSKMDDVLLDDSKVVFIPPVSGG